MAEMIMDGIIALNQAKKYVAKSLDGLGALKGANCVIESVETVPEGNRVTFSWTGTSGTKETTTILVKNGEQGNGIAKVEKIKTVDLIDTYRMTFDDGTTFDYEVTNGDSSLGGKIDTVKVNGVELPVVDKAVDIEIPEYIYIGNTEPTDENIVLWVNPDEAGGSAGAGGSYSGTSGIDIGGIKKNQTFTDATLQEMFDMLLHPYEKPTMTLGINPTKTIYDKVTETLASITINANVTKKTENIKEVRFYVDNVLVNTDTSHPNGGLASYTHTFASPTNTTFNVKIECEDIKGATSKVSANTNVYFVGKSYYGCLPEGTTIDETSIKTLNTVLKKELKYKYSGITTTGTNLYHIVLCQPKEFGTITSVKDALNFEYIQDYTVRDIIIDGIDYTLMYLTNPVSVTDFLQDFK